MPQPKKSGLDKFLSESMREDGEFRKLFWNEVAKTPTRSRRKLESRLSDLPK